MVQFFDSATSQVVSGTSLHFCVLLCQRLFGHSFQGSWLGVQAKTPSPRVKRSQKVDEARVGLPPFRKESFAGLRLGLVFRGLEFGFMFRVLGLRPTVF